MILIHTGFLTTTIINLLYCCDPYEYMDDWEKFNERPLPEKKVFSINLNMEDITDAD